MGNKIRILIVNDNEESLNSIKGLLEPIKDFKIIGEATDGQQAIDLTSLNYPDIVLMDTNMPKLDGFQAALKINHTLPYIGIILMGSVESIDIIRESMKHGADDFLELPLSSTKLKNSILSVYKIKTKQKEKLLLNPLIIPNREPKIITVFSSKGGVGKSVISTNVAVALKKFTKEDVLLMDLDLQFGDIADLLNIAPKTSIIDLLSDMSKIEGNEWDKYLSDHYSGLKVLTSPAKPEDADYVSESDIKEIITEFKKTFDYIVIDTPPLFNGVSVGSIQMSNQVILLTTTEVPTLRNVKDALDALKRLEFPHEKITVVINRFNSKSEIKLDDIVKFLEMGKVITVNDEPDIVSSSINIGDPFVLRYSESGLTKQVFDLTDNIIDYRLKQKTLKKSSKFKRIFKRRVR